MKELNNKITERRRLTADELATVSFASFNKMHTARQYFKHDVCVISFPFLFVRRQPFR
jgi:hypothetical protein